MEATSGKINITDASAVTIENLLFFLYHGDLDQTKINGDLLVAAEKYEIKDLINACVNYMMENLTEKNAADILISAYLVDNQKILFRRAYKFIFQNRLIDKVVETDDWKGFEKKDP